MHLDWFHQHWKVFNLHQHLVLHLHLFGKNRYYSTLFLWFNELTAFSALQSLLFQIILELLFSYEVSSFWCALSKRQTYNDCYVQTFSLSYMGAVTTIATTEASHIVVSFAHIALTLKIFLSRCFCLCGNSKEKNTNFHVWKMNCIWSNKENPNLVWWLNSG